MAIIKLRGLDGQWSASAKLEIPFENPIRGFARAAFSFVRNVSRLPFSSRFCFPFFHHDGLTCVYRACLSARLSGCPVVGCRGASRSVFGCIGRREALEGGRGVDTVVSEREKNR